MRFDLQGSVKKGVVDAINRHAGSASVQLKAQNATFLGGVTFEGVTFETFDAPGTRFQRGVTFRRCVFEDSCSLDRVRAKGATFERCDFRGTVELRRVEMENLKVLACTFADYVTFDGMTVQSINVRNADFAAEVRIRGARIRNSLTLIRASCAAALTLRDSAIGALNATSCKFEGPFETDSTAIAQHVKILGSRVDDSRSIELETKGFVALESTSFRHPIRLVTRTPDVSVSACTFEGGVDLVAQPGARLRLDAVSMDGPSIVTTETLDNDERLASLVSVRGARLGRTVLRDLDLSECLFAEAHALEDVLISGARQLDLAPRPLPGISPREVIADEKHVRHGLEVLRRPYGPHHWHVAAPGHVTASAGRLAETYRALRRGREEGRDRPGAADFYFGEMEMRRLAADSRSERYLLTAYWFASGYGLRASRALFLFVLLILILTSALDLWGLDQEYPFPDVLAYVLATTTVVAQPAVKLNLDTFGSFLFIVARILGPALFALFALALRSRVRR